MNKVIRLIQTYLMYSSPFVLICMLWSSISNEKEILSGAGFITKLVWETLSWNLILWFALLVFFLIVLVFVPRAREKTLYRLANLKERDEREEHITGKASRTVYISTLALLIFFLFVSIFSVNISKIPEDQIFDGKSKRVSIGLSFNLFDEARVQTDSSGKILFETKDIPLSKSAILLILIFWQIAAFNLSARKANRLELGE